MARVHEMKVLKAPVGWILGLTVLFAGCASRDLYPEFKFSETVHHESGAEILRRQWTYSIEPLSSSLIIPGMEYVAPVIHQNSLIFGSQRWGLVSLYPKIQQVKWKLPIENGVVSPIEILNDRAFFVGGDGILYAISTETGKTLWTYSIRNPVTSKPTVIDNELYVVTADDALLALEADTGKWLWHYRRRNSSGPTIHGASRPLVVGDALWVGFADGALVAVARKDGKVRWEKTLNTNRRFANVNAELVRVGNKVFVPAYDGALYALDAQQGSPIWVRDGLGGSKRVTVEAERVFVPTSDGMVQALDINTGKPVWKFELDQGIASDIAVMDRHVVFASSSEYFYALEKETGKLAFRYHVGSGAGFSGGLAVDRERNWLYVLSRGGNLMSWSYHARSQ